MKHPPRRSGAVGLSMLLVLAGAGGPLAGAGLARPLVEAVKAGDAGSVRTLLANATSVDQAETDGTTALHWAAQRNDLVIADLLIAAGAPVSAANRYGVTPLYLAAINGSAPMVERLLGAGADPRSALPQGETALMTAARSGDVATVRLLLAHGADPNAREGWKGQTALMWAAAENNPAAVAALVAAGAEVGARTSDGGFTPLLFAVRGGQIDAARALLDAGADVEDSLPDGTSGLVLAAINAHYEMGAVLLEYGADPNSARQGWTTLHQIAWSRRWNRGFNLPGPVETGNLDSLDLVRQLVAHGANVNARQTQEPADGNRNKLNRIGATAFLLAAKADDVPLMRTLLEQGADPSLTTEEGTTALMAAAGVGIWAPGENPGTHEEALAAVKLAYESGGGAVTDVNANGETALHGAVYRGGAIPVIEYLAERGARLDAVNNKGWMPVTAADGQEYTPNVLKRYPEAAALLRRLMREQGLPVPPSVQPGREGELAAIAEAAPVEEPGHAGIGDAALGDQEISSGAVPDRTIWDGVFSEAQASRGQQAYGQSCAVCHLSDLLGEGAAPALIGSAFTTRWTGVTLHDMVETIRSSMPQEAPDSLSDQVYADIVSYLLKRQGSPPGATELPAESAEQAKVTITER